MLRNDMLTICAIFYLFNLNQLLRNSICEYNLTLSNTLMSLSANQYY